MTDSHNTHNEIGLYQIYYSECCEYIRQHINIIKKSLLKYIDNSLPNNTKNNLILCQILLFDVIYYQFKYTKPEIKKYEPMIINDHTNEIINCDYLKECLNSIKIFYDLIGKKYGVEKCAIILLNNIIDIIDNFVHHNKQLIVNNIKYFPMAFAYGSTCFVYKLNNNIIMKNYGKYLRWKNKDHDDIEAIFKKELKYLKILKNSNFFTKLIDYDEINHILILTYEGESLFDKFNLPENWRTQIVSIFDELKKYKIVYTEFNIKNIVVDNDIIKFIDFGLVRDELPNETYDYCNSFIKILETLNCKLSNESSNENKMVLYDMFISNVKSNNVFSHCIY